MIKTKRWNDPRKKSDGMRILVCRYRPRALPKEDETWHLWWPDLGPSRELHAAFYGKNGPPISWEDYRARYLEEMKGQEEKIALLAEKALLVVLSERGPLPPLAFERADRGAAAERGREMKPTLGLCRGSAEMRAGGFTCPCPCQ